MDLSLNDATASALLMPGCDDRPKEATSFEKKIKKFSR